MSLSPIIPLRGFLVLCYNKEVKRIHPFDIMGLSFILMLALPAPVSPIIPPTIMPKAIVREAEIKPKAEMTETEIITNKIKTVFGKDAEVMTKVATCESSLKQFDDKGQVVKSKTGDSGLFQINSCHNKKLKELNLDVSKLDDNIAYAHYLFQANGLKDWEASRQCWKTS